MLDLIDQISEWFLHLNPAIQALLRALLYVVPILLLVPGFIWWERRLLSWMQDRIGPNRVATYTFGLGERVPEFLRGKKIKLFGLLQPIADGVKLFLKEDITPTAVDRVIYFIAPAIALFPAFALGGTIPWSADIYLTPVSDANIGILYILAISSLGVYGVVLAGYGSDNKYSLMGGLRASAQLISYELAMGMSLAGIALWTGSLKPTDMVRMQQGGLWGIEKSPISNWNLFTPFGFVAAVVFLICMVAETNRAPFDLPEAENELIAGYHTEYSSMKFAVFFMGEYAAMFVFSGVFATVFLGGYDPLPIRWDQIGWAGVGHFMASPWIGALTLIFKCFLGLTGYIWLRATLPRLRYDQLMSLGWKSLLPLAVSNFVLVGLWILLSTLYPDNLPRAAGETVAAALIMFVFYKGISTTLSDGKDRMDSREIDMVSGVRAIELVEPTKTTT